MTERRTPDAVQQLLMLHVRGVTRILDFRGVNKTRKKEGVNNVNLIISLVYCQEIAK